MTRSHDRTHTVAPYATIAMVAACAAVGLASPASADATTLNVPVNMRCTANGDPLQACNGGVFSTSLPNDTTPKEWTIQFTLSADDNCAPLMMQIRDVPNVGPISVQGNERLAPGQSTHVYELPNTQGKGATVELHATGIQEGCNTGTLEAWAGNLQIGALGHA
jgi:hypothetical protein